MDLEKAVAKHAEWKTRLRLAIARKEAQDAATIRKDNCCDLGRWLHGDGKAQHGAEPAFREVVTRHAAFHVAAGKVAEAINQGQYERAEALLANGTEYGQASSELGTAVIRLKKQATAKA